MRNEYIELTKLVKSPLNVRKTVAKGASEELKASILAHGLMQNLVVTAAPKGKYHVIAGARRLEALKAIQKSGIFGGDYAVPCQIVSDEHAAEMSLAENVVRLAMHPADQFEAFAALIDNGHTAAQVAGRFGVTEKLVEQRMRLARVAPELLADYRAEKFTLEALTAFTVTDDHQKQLAVYESLSEWQLKRPSDIRDQLTEQMVEANDKLVRFVTLETYQAAGGTIKTDLFGEEVYLENPELLHALVREKLALTEKELLTEGWVWALAATERDWQTMQGFTRIEPEAGDIPPELAALVEKAEAEVNAIADEMDALGDEEWPDDIYDRQRRAEENLDALNEEVASSARFTPDQMQTAGCYAYIGHDGNLEIQKGLVKREDAKKAAQVAAGDTEADEPAKKPKGLPQSLLDDLATHRMQAAKVEIAKNPAIAFDLMVYTAACRILNNHPIYDGADIRFTPHIGTNNVNRAETPAGNAFDKIRDELPVEWMNPTKTEAERFIEFQLLSDADKHALLSYCVAETLQPKLESAWEDEPTAYDVALWRTHGKVADYWRPTKDNYLSRITRDQLLALGREILGETWASSRNGDKKGQLADELHRAFADPEKYGKSPQQVAKLKSWLPAGMAFPAMPEKAKKGKKAA